MHPLAFSLEESEISSRRHGRTPWRGSPSRTGRGRTCNRARRRRRRRGDRPDVRAPPSVAFRPGSSLTFAEGTTSLGPYREMLERGVTVWLGTDGVAPAGT
jgi:hypothetical protein